MTVRERVVELLRVPETPVMVKNVTLGAAADVAVSVNVVTPCVGFCENDPVTPLGRPETVKATLPLKPFTLFT